MFGPHLPAAGPRFAPGLMPMGPDEPAEPQCLLFWCRTLTRPLPLVPLSPLSLFSPFLFSLSLNVMDSVTLRLNKSPRLRCLLGFFKTGRHGYTMGGNPGYSESNEGKWQASIVRVSILALSLCNASSSGQQPFLIRLTLLVQRVASNIEGIVVLSQVFSKRTGRLVFVRHER